MNWVDILVILVTALAVLAILFYKFVLPHLNKKKGKASSNSCCNEGQKTSKRIIDAYYHEKRKEEKKKAKEAEERQALEEKYNALLRENAVSKNKTKLLGLGYDEKLADETAEAMADGDLDKVFKNQKKFLEGFEKSIRAEVLKDTPEPTGDGDTKTMTLEGLRKMTPMERMKYSQEHPDEYKALYSEGENNNNQ